MHHHSFMTGYCKYIVASPLLPGPSTVLFMFIKFCGVVEAYSKSDPLRQEKLLY